MEFKASDHRENLLAYIECVDDITGTYTKQLIQNLKLVERKDLTKAGENAPLKNKGGYNVCKMMTYRWTKYRRTFVSHAKE